MNFTIKAYSAFPLYQKTIDTSNDSLTTFFIEISDRLIICISYSVLLIDTLWSIVFLTSYDLIIVQNLRVRSLKYVKKTFDFNWSKLSSWSTIEFKISSWSFARVYLTHLSVLIGVDFLIVKTGRSIDFNITKDKKRYFRFQ